MPKRPNPFQDEISLPFKTYVRQKEVDLGVNRAENMKLVYDKTLKLLFNGASTLSKTENGISNGYHQKAVANGHTHQNGHATTNGKLNGDSNIIQKRNTCCMSNVNYKCSFCEKCICSTCQQICVKCEEIFCSICSILQYRERDEIALCLLCINDA